MKKLIIACADFTFPLLEHDKVLDLIAMLDCEGVDIGLFSGRSHLRPEKEFANTKENARLLKMKLHDRGLIPSDVYLQLDTSLSGNAINHPDEKVRLFAREQFLKLVEYAHVLGADHITCLPGMYFPNQSNEKSLEICYHELTWRLKQIQNTSLCFAVESHIGSPFINPLGTRRLLDAVPGLTLTLDYTHFIKEGYEQEDIDHLLEYASHFHARGARKGYLQTSMTHNTINYKSIINKLIKLGYDGWIGIEYIWIDWENCNEVDTLSETIRLRDTIKNAYLEAIPL
jgi:sugar phosphate isomerase/epimerase